MFIADKTEKRCLVACNEQTKKDGRCTCLSKSADTKQLLQTAVICCGNLERMDINWMVLEDGTRLMPYINSKESEVVKLRINNCPSCGAYVRDCTIKP